MRVVFMGSPDFALPTFDLLRQNYEVCAAVTQPDRVGGRGRKVRQSAVKQRALTESIPLIQPDSLRESNVQQELIALHPDLIVVAAFGQIIPPNLLNLPKHGCLNVHASLLPRWRGAAPVQAAILAGDALSGVTIMFMDEGLDTGPILTQRETPIGDSDTGGVLSDRLSLMGAELLIESIPGFIQGDIVPRSQDPTQATYASMLKKSDGLIDPDHSANRLARQVRAYTPWPSSFFYWRENRIVVHAAAAHASQGPQHGRVIEVDGQPAISTSAGSLILQRIQPAGKREMAALEFINGAPDFIGSSILLEKS